MLTYCLLLGIRKSAEIDTLAPMPSFEILGPRYPPALNSHRVARMCNKILKRSSWKIIVKWEHVNV